MNSKVETRYRSCVPSRGKDGNLPPDETSQLTWEDETMRKVATGRGFAEAVGRMEDVSTHGSLKARSVDGMTVWGAGRLAGKDHDTFTQDAPSIRYVVESYATPIAWVTEDGRVHKVAQKFSVTTSKHQGQLYLLGAQS